MKISILASRSPKQIRRPKNKQTNTQTNNLTYRLNKKVALVRKQQTTDIGGFL